MLAQLTEDFGRITQIRYYHTCVTLVLYFHETFASLILLCMNLVQYSTAKSNSLLIIFLSDSNADHILLLLQQFL